MATKKSAGTRRAPKRLWKEHKPYVVTWLARFKTPTEVQALIKEHLDFEMSLQAIQGYDPTTMQGRSLSKELVKVFNDARAKYIAAVDEIPIAHEAYRLNELQKMLDRQKRAKHQNDPLTMSVLEQAAKERGQAFTNKREMTGANGAPLFPPASPEVLEALKKGYEQLAGGSSSGNDKPGPKS